MSEYNTGAYCRKCYGENFGCIDCALPVGVTLETATPSDRERFLALLYSHPLLRADAIVVLCGEDMGPRLSLAAQLYQAGAAAGVVLSGGKHGPPRWMGADAARLDLLGRGIAPDRIIIEADSMNTREQAVNVTALAREKGWTRLLLVASSYHLPRAFLTFLAANEDGLRLMPAAAAAPWSQAPEGMAMTRAMLLDAEYRKIEDYGNHVATFAEGLAHLERWDGQP